MTGGNGGAGGDGAYGGTVVAAVGGHRNGSVSVTAQWRGGR